MCRDTTYNISEDSNTISQFLNLGSDKALTEITFTILQKFSLFHPRET